MKTISFQLQINLNLFLTNFSLLKPNDSQQNEALLAAMTEILWQIGEKSMVSIVLPGEVAHVAHSHTYFQDSVTEKVQI